MATESRFIEGPAGRIDSRWHGPHDGAPILLLHPHPFHGGSMGTRMIYQLAKALAEDGRRVVRFDFRGVGRSAGAYDRGVGETEDGLAMYDALREEAGTDPIVIGFSFGGGVATKVAAARNPPKLVCIATPHTLRDSDLPFTHDAPSVGCPVHLVYGDQDELVDEASAKALAASFASPHWHVLEGADHFLTPTHIPRAVEAVRKALGEQDL